MEQRDNEENTLLLLAAQVAEGRVRYKLNITVSPGWQQRGHPDLYGQVRLRPICEPV